MDDIFNKVGYDPAANAQVKRKAPGADSQDQSAGAGGGGLPRMDLSTLLDKVHATMDKQAIPMRPTNVLSTRTYQWIFHTLVYTI